MRISDWSSDVCSSDLARMFALQWHQKGLASYISFEGKTDHHDAEIRHAQEWLSTHFSVARPVDEIISRSRLAERTFKRRLDRKGVGSGTSVSARVVFGGLRNIIKKQ